MPPVPTATRKRLPINASSLFPKRASSTQPIAYTTLNTMMVRNFPQKTSEMIAPIIGKKYAPALKVDCHEAAFASVNCICDTMKTVRIELMP